MGDLAKTLLLAGALLGATSCGKKQEDAGPTSSPAIISELAGPRKALVGAWVESDAKGAPRHLDIGPRGGVRYLRKDSVPPYGKETIEGLIVGFKGDDIEVIGANAGTILVTVPPHRASDSRWQMTAMGATFER